MGEKIDCFDFTSLQYSWGNKTFKRSNTGMGPVLAIKIQRRGHFTRQALGSWQGTEAGARHGIKDGKLRMLDREAVHRTLGNNSLPCYAQGF